MYYIIYDNDIGEDAHTHCHRAESLNLFLTRNFDSYPLPRPRRTTAVTMPVRRPWRKFLPATTIACVQRVCGCRGCACPIQQDSFMAMYIYLHSYIILLYTYILTTERYARAPACVCVPTRT